jgi:hypothetical protein
MFGVVDERHNGNRTVPRRSCGSRVSDEWQGYVASQVLLDCAANFKFFAIPLELSQRLMRGDVSLCR